MAKNMLKQSIDIDIDIDIDRNKAAKKRWLRNRILTKKAKCAPGNV